MDKYRKIEPGRMIELRNLEFEYPRSEFHLRVKQLKIEAGTKAAVIGPSGSGKTTLLSLIAGILVPGSGSVMVGSTRVNKLTEKERRDFRISTVGFVFQDFRLISYLNGMDNILLPFRINNTVQMDDNTDSTLHLLMKGLGIEDKMKKYPGQLSHGEKQRLAICRALITGPDVILADEPTGNLDPENKKKIMRILFDYVERNNSTLITVTHDHELLSGFDTVVNFKDFQYQRS